MKHDGFVRGAVLTKAEERIPSWSADWTVRLWDAATGQPVGAPMKHDGPVVGAVFIKAEDRIPSWSYDGAVRLWGAATRQPVGAPMKHDGPVVGAVFIKAEDRILSWSDDGTVRLWDAATGQSVGAPTKHDNSVAGAVFTKAKERILSWSDDGAVRLWDVQRLNRGNLTEVSCRLLAADKGTSALDKDFGIKVAYPICANRRIRYAVDDVILAGRRQVLARASRFQHNDPRHQPRAKGELQKLVGSTFDRFLTHYSGYAPPLG